MKYRQDNDAAILCAEINAVGETSGDDTPNILANNGKLERVFGRQRDTTVNFGHELKGKTISFAFVPRVTSRPVSDGLTQAIRG